MVLTILDRRPIWIPTLSRSHAVHRGAQPSKNCSMSASVILLGDKDKKSVPLLGGTLVGFRLCSFGKLEIESCGPIPNRHRQWIKLYQTRANIVVLSPSIIEKFCLKCKPYAGFTGTKCKLPSVQVCGERGGDDWPDAEAAEAFESIRSKLMSRSLLTSDSIFSKLSSNTFSKLLSSSLRA